jgi:hypothetical protein
MPFQWMQKKQWVALLLLGAVGCAKVDLPRLGEGGRVGAPESTSPQGKSATSTIRSSKSLPAGMSPVQIEQMCSELSKTMGIPNHKIEEYSHLKDLLRKMSAVVRGDEELLARAHESAFVQTNTYIRGKLIGANNRPTQLSQGYEAMVQQAFPDGRRQGNEKDLEAIIAIVSAEGPSCGNVFLHLFYSNFVAAVDPSSKLEFVLGAEASSPLVCSKQGDTVNSFSSSGTIRKMGPSLVGDAAWIPRQQWTNVAQLGPILQMLESEGTRANRRPIVLDLRSTGGSDETVLRAFQDSAAKNWGSSPLIIVTNYATHGFAAVFAYEMAEKRNVVVLGIDPQTYGFARTLNQCSSPALADGTSPLNLILGDELVERPGESRQHGAMLKIAAGNWLNQMSSADLTTAVANRAEQLGLAVKAEVAEQQQHDQPQQDQQQPLPQAVPAEQLQADPSANPVATAPQVEPNQPLPPGEAQAAATQESIPMLEIPPGLPADAARSDAPPQAFGT